MLPFKGFFSQFSRLVTAVERLARAVDDVATLYYQDAGQLRPNASKIDPKVEEKVVQYASDETSWAAEQRDQRDDATGGYPEPLT